MKLNLSLGAGVGEILVSSGWHSLEPSPSTFEKFEVFKLYLELTRNEPIDFIQSKLVVLLLYN